VREVVRDSCGVVHMAVSEQDVVNGDELIGGLADIETDVELGHSDDGFLAGHRIAEDFQIINLNSC